MTQTPEGRRLPSGVAEAVAILAKEMEPRRIILFGSIARGDGDAESDLDLLVILDRFDSRFAEMRRASRALAPLKLPTDVLVYSQAEVDEWGDVVNHVINEALLDGLVVYDAA
jgi:predicted nucleotidyltransferase